MAKRCCPGSDQENYAKWLPEIKSKTKFFAGKHYIQHSYIYIVSGVLASLKLPIILVSNLTAAVVVGVFNPPDEALQPANKGISNADSATVGCKLGYCGTDIRDILQQYFSKVSNALEAFVPTIAPH